MMGNQTKPLTIVNSGDYTIQELSAEFGVLPPAFLPVGLSRLYELQASWLESENGDLYLTIPDSFVVSEWDQRRLASLGFNLIRTPDSISLGSALLFALARVGFKDRPLVILHGDTLISGPAMLVDDMISVSRGGDGYRWGEVELIDSSVISVLRPRKSGDEDKSHRLCGYFRLKSATEFAESLALAGGDFYDALNLYNNVRPLQALETPGWLDFGHVQTFFRSRRIVTTERSFNSLTIGEMHVRKRSVVHASKLAAEAKWLAEAPPMIAPFCARVLNSGADSEGCFYDTEYEFMPTLAELFVFGRVQPPAWTLILASCKHFLDATVSSFAELAAPNLFERLVVNKTRQRLHQLAATTGVDLAASNILNGKRRPSFLKCLDDIEHVVHSSTEVPSLMHGDFCFSNILFSFRTGRIRLIDPRAIDEEGRFTKVGDVKYDIAKLMHSIFGRYDLIVAGHYSGASTFVNNEFELEFERDANRECIEAAGKELEMGGVSLGSSAVWAGMTSLFLSMPPLHSDRPDRQKAFLANALRLHQHLEKLA